MIKHFFIFLLLIVFASCANKVTPTGGPKDVTPPSLVNAIPENNTTNFNASEILLNFDEYVQINDPTQILISPIPDKAPIFKTSKKSVSIQFESPLMPNTTYTINFGKALVDVHEGNVNDTLNYVFSTGSTIDSLFIAGKVLEAQTLKPCNKYSVLLYSIIDRTNLDSLIVKKPDYFGRTSESGKFLISNLKKGSYYLLAVDDKNNNYLYDKEETLGFMSGVIDLPINEELQINTFVPLPEQLRMMKSGMLDKTTALVVYNLPTDPTIEAANNKINKQQFYFDKSIKGDSLFIHLKDTSVSEAQFIFSSSNLLNDTVSFSFTEKKKNDLSLEIIAPQKTNDTIKISSNHPLQNTELYAYLFKDTIIIDSVKLYQSALKSLQLNYQKFERGINYRLSIPKGNIKDVYGNENDSLQFNISIIDKEHSGNILVHLDYGQNTNPFLIQLLNADFAILKEQRILKGQSVKDLSFDFIQPGKYYIRVVDDADNNQQWTTGKINKQQPERIWLSELFTVRANWDLDIPLKINNHDRQLIESN